MSSSQGDRHTRLRNVAHPCAPARGPSRSPGIASTTASGRAPVEAPTGKVVDALVGQPHHRGSCRAGPLRGERCDRSPRGGSPGHRCPISLLHIGSLHNAITASSSTRSSARYERASAKGQPHSARQRHTQAACIPPPPRALNQRRAGWPPCPALLRCERFRSAFRCRERRSRAIDHSG